MPYDRTHASNINIVTSQKPDQGGNLFGKERKQCGKRGFQVLVTSFVYAYFIQQSFLNNLHLLLSGLTPSQTSPGFYVSAV